MWDITIRADQTVTQQDILQDVLNAAALIAR
jgi:hypothetical protein